MDPEPGRLGVRARCRTMAFEGAARGYTPMQLVTFLGLVCPEVPGTWGYRAWHDEKRRIAGRKRRRREPAIEFTGWLPFAD